MHELLNFSVIRRETKFNF